MLPYVVPSKRNVNFCINFSFIVLLIQGIQTSIEFKALISQMKSGGKTCQRNRDSSLISGNKSKTAKGFEAAKLGTCYMIIWPYNNFILFYFDYEHRDYFIHPSMKHKLQ